METVIQSLLGIVVSLTLSGCLVNTPPGVPVLPEAQAAKVYDLRHEEGNREKAEKPRSRNAASRELKAFSPD